MGNQQTKQNYHLTGNVHVKEFGSLMAYYQHWPTPPENINLHDHTKSGRWLCDANGIPRDGDYCRIGNFTSKFPGLYSDLNVHCLEN